MKSVRAYHQTVRGVPFNLTCMYVTPSGAVTTVRLGVGVAGHLRRPPWSPRDFEEPKPPSGFDPSPCLFVALYPKGALERLQMDGVSLPGLLVWYVVFLFSTTFHEFFHALIGLRLGDSTAHAGGQVTLDPLPHVRRSVFGMVVWPLISFFFSGGRWMFGWASAPYDPNWAVRHPRRYALMSLSGPVANFLLAALGILVIRLLVGQGVLELSLPPDTDSLVVPAGGQELPVLSALSMALSVLVTLNVVLGVFNLIPVPPLDGFGVLEGLAPKGNSTFFQVLKVTPAYQFLGMVLAWRFADVLIRPALDLTLRALYV